MANHPWRSDPPLPRTWAGKNQSKLATYAGAPSVIAAVDGADCAPDDDFYVGAARNSQTSETYIKARRLG